MAKSKRTAQHKIDWSSVGDKVCEILSITRDYPPGLVDLAREQSVPYESVVAAAITGMVSEHVEAELAKPSRRKVIRTRSRAG